MLFFRRMRERAQKQVAAERALETPDALSGVGPLAEALWLGDRKLQARAATALIRLLPRLTTADAPLLNNEQRACLHRALNDSNAPLTIAVLKALEQVGDGASLWKVQKLAVSGNASAEEGRIRQAATECLPLLRKRVEQHPTTLLRPSSEPMYPKQLLKASQSPGVPSSALRQSEDGADK